MTKPQLVKYLDLLAREICDCDSDRTLFDFCNPTKHEVICRFYLVCCDGGPKPSLLKLSPEEIEKCRAEAEAEGDDFDVNRDEIPTAKL